jgi:hypothetical protein
VPLRRSDDALWRPSVEIAGLNAGFGEVGAHFALEPSDGVSTALPLDLALRPTTVVLVVDDLLRSEARSQQAMDGRRRAVARAVPDGEIDSGEHLSVVANLYVPPLITTLSRPRYEPHVAWLIAAIVVAAIHLQVRSIPARNCANVAKKRGVVITPLCAHGDPSPAVVAVLATARVVAAADGGIEAVEQSLTMLFFRHRGIIAERRPPALAKIRSVTSRAAVSALLEEV